jgi:PAS domain S-box-containing protein
VICLGGQVRALRSSPVAPAARAQPRVGRQDPRNSPAVALQGYKRPMPDAEQSAEASRLLSESIPAQVWTARPDGALDHVNREVLEYFGRSREQMLGEGWLGVIHEQDAAAVLERWTHSLTTGESYEVEFRLRRADGEYLWHIGRARAQRDDAGRIIRWFGINTDIDRQRRIGQAQRFIVEASSLLAASLDYETTLASVARLAVPHIATWCTVDLLIDPDPADPTARMAGPELRRVTVAHVDPRKVALAHELQRRYPVDMNAPSGVPQVLRTGESELVSVIEDWMLVAGCKDQEQLRIARELGLTSSMCVPLKARGRTLGAISLLAAEPGRHYDDDDMRVAEALAVRCAVAIDNASLLRQAQDAEKDLRRLNEELERRVVGRTAELKRARERALEANVRLKELDSMKDEFLNALSYQLSSPINAVIGYTDLLLEGGGGPLRDEQRRYIRRITASSRVLLSLVNDLLDMSRMSAGKFILDREDLDPGALARDVLGHLEPLTEMQGLRVVTRVADRLGELVVDPQRLEQVLTNVLHNAIQLTPSGGLLRLSVERVAHDIRVEVHHSGDSLTPAELDQIFRRFTRIGGAWLGLSISQRVVEAHGGTMGVAPNPDGGNTFWVTIPAPARPTE